MESKHSSITPVPRRFISSKFPYVIGSEKRPHIRDLHVSCKVKTSGGVKEINDSRIYIRKMSEDGQQYAFTIFVKGSFEDEDFISFEVVEVLDHKIEKIIEQMIESQKLYKEAKEAEYEAIRRRKLAEKSAKPTSDPELRLMRKSSLELSRKAENLFEKAKTASSRRISPVYPRENCRFPPVDELMKKIESCTMESVDFPDRKFSENGSSSGSISSPSSYLSNVHFPVIIEEKENPGGKKSLILETVNEVDEFFSERMDFAFGTNSVEKSSEESVTFSRISPSGERIYSCLSPKQGITTSDIVELIQRASRDIGAGLGSLDEKWE